MSAIQPRNAIKTLLQKLVTGAIDRPSAAAALGAYWPHPMRAGASALTMSYIRHMVDDVADGATDVDLATTGLLESILASGCGRLDMAGIQSRQ